MLESNAAFRVITENHVFEESDQRKRPQSKLGSNLYDHSQEIRCGNWRDFNIGSLHSLNPPHAVDHVVGSRTTFPWGSDFCSISTSPRRTLNYLATTTRDEKIKIAVLDLRILDKLGIPNEKMTGRGGSYGTKHHIIAPGWIPARSILGFLTVGAFDGLLKVSGISMAPKGIQ